SGHGPRSFRIEGPSGIRPLAGGPGDLDLLVIKLRIAIPLRGARSAREESGDRSPHSKEHATRRKDTEAAQRAQRGRMLRDLSHYHRQIGHSFSASGTGDYHLSPDQVEFYREHGYLAGIRILTGEQVEALREELALLADSSQPGHHLFYEYHSNESPDPAK